MIEHHDLTKIYKTQWRAYYKTGLGGPTIVYGESEREAMANALAEYRKSRTLVGMWPMEKVVERVELIG